MAPRLLRLLLQSLATLDAILCVDDYLRYHSFNSHWADDQQMASMSNGAGDHYFVLFDAQGCFFKGFDHECDMTPYCTDPPLVWEGVLSAVPEVYSQCLVEPAFDMISTTFCFWWDSPGARWQHGPVMLPSGHDPDGSVALLSMLDGKFETYRTFASEYFEVEIEPVDIAHIFAHRPLTDEIVQKLNPERTLKSLTAELAEIGYPSAM